MKDINTLFKGVGMIIDDEVEERGTNAFNLRESLENHGIPMVSYKYIPDEQMTESMGSISFVILDWQFASHSVSFLTNSHGMEVSIGDEYLTDSKTNILSFLKNLLKKCFLPVFVVTDQDFSKVKDVLSKENIYEDGKPSRIMLKQKADVQDYESLLEQVKYWMKKNPPAYVLKLWEHEAIRAKNDLFLDMFNASPDWVGVMLKCIKNDSSDSDSIDYEFNSFICSSFINRIKSGKFSEITIPNEACEPDILRSIIQGERYIGYNEEPTISYTGDLYYNPDTKVYSLNIRPQCDLLRKDNPLLYIIEGNAIDRTDVTRSKIRITNSDKGCFVSIGNGENECISNLNGNNLKEVNNKIDNHIKRVPIFSKASCKIKSVDSR